MNSSHNPIRLLLPLVVLVAISLVQSPAEATIMNVVGSSAWVGENPGNSGGGAAGVAQVGTGGSTAPLGLGGLFYFALPTLPASETVTASSLSVELTNARDVGTIGQVPHSFNADLYYLGVRNAATINKPGDFGETGGTLPAGATLVQDDWWVMNDDSQIGTTKVIDVTSEIATAFASNTPIDNFAVFGLYGDIDLSTLGTGSSVETFFFEDSTTPDLSITSETATSAVPEPSTFLLAALGFLALRRRRRRK